MVLFPEGGFLRKRREASQRYGEKRGLPLLKNVTLPRIGAMQAILESLPTRTSSGNNNGASKRVENGNLLTVTSEGKSIKYFYLFLIRKYSQFIFSNVCFRSNT